MPTKIKAVFIDADGSEFDFDVETGCVQNIDNNEDVIALSTKADCDDLITFIQWVKDQIVD